MSETLLPPANSFSPTHKDNGQTGEGPEGNFYLMLAQAPVAVALLNGPQYTIEFANEKFLQLTGKATEDLLRQRILESGLSIFPDGIKHSLDAVLAEGKPRSYNEHIAYIKRRGASERVWLNIVLQPLIGTGDRERITIFITDVTENMVARLRDKEEQSLLRRVKEQLELSISIGHIGIWHWDVKKDVLTWSKEQLELYGIKEQDFGGRIADFHRFVLPEDLELLKNTGNFERIADGDYEYRFRVRRTDGQVRWIQGRSRSFYSANGEIDYRIGVNVDVTERQKAEEALRQSEERFRSTFDNAAVGISHVALDGSWLVVNDRLCAIVGYTQGELLSSTFQHITHPDDLDTDLQMLHEVLEDKRKTYTLEKRYIHKSGAVVWINLTVSLVRKRDGSPKYFISVVEDISERKRAEEALRESEVRFRNLSDHAPLWVWLSDEHGNVTYANKEERVFFGLDEQDEFSPKLWEKFLHPADLNRVYQQYGEAIAETKAYSIEARMFNKATGIHEWFLFRGVPRIEAGSFKGVIGTALNIHQQKILTEKLEGLVRERTTALEQANAELYRSNEDLQQFAHVASHDLKEPIRKVSTFGSRLREEYGHLLPERGQLYLQKVLSSAERMFGLIDGVLNYSTVNSLEGTTEKVNLDELVQHIESDLEVLLHQTDGRIIRKPLPAVSGSAVLLNQLFYNLLNNALKFTRQGLSPVVIIDAKRVHNRDVAAITNEETEKEFFEISICDNGIGFKPEHAQKIFKTFTRLNSRDRYEGTGLGLALCKKIVERHNGYIYATGKEGEGACFYILLPV